ncbi:MAG: DnaT-like ssDNA-binding protein [Candidatus Phlomobacter fragariae]
MVDSNITSPAFNSYASVEDLKRYARERGIDIPVDDLRIESMLINAMDYLASQRWLGKRTRLTQPLSFPRNGLFYDGVPVANDVIPGQLIMAQCRLAIESESEDLQPTVGGEVTSERIEGAITVQYAPGTNAGSPKFTWLNSLLNGLLDTYTGFAINAFSMR